MCFMSISNLPTSNSTLRSVYTTHFPLLLVFTKPSKSLCKEAPNSPLHIKFKTFCF